MSERTTIDEAGADLAAAREIIMDYYASGFCPDHVMDKPCAKDCTLARTSAFLERTATDPPPQAFIEAKRERDDGWPDMDMKKGPVDP